MSDSLPGLSGEMGAGKPLTPAEFRKRERERKALQHFIEGKTYAQIKNAMGLRNTDAARELVQKGEQRWMKEEGAALPRYRAAMRNDLMEMRGILVEMSRGENLAAMDRLIKVWERMARLEALDAEKEKGDDKGNTYILQAGGDIRLVPPGGDVVDLRAPWERGETIDSTGETIKEIGDRG